jgi:hypothetical protein
MAAKRAPKTAKTKRVFGQRQAPPKMFRAGLYARVSTHDQQTLPSQIRAMREYAAKRGWTIAVQIKEVGSGAAERELREELLAAARRREIDVVLVWRLDRWGRSLVDLVVTMKELAQLGVGFVSMTEALDLTTPRAAQWQDCFQYSQIMRSARLCKATAPNWRRGRHIRDVELRIITGRKGRQ